jgi:hypothetical protein
MSVPDMNHSLSGRAGESQQLDEALFPLFIATGLWPHPVISCHVM